MSLKSEGMKGSKWTSLSTLTVSAIQILQLVILSRILSPVDFGIMGIIQVVLGFANIYSDAGISNVILARDDLNSKNLSSLYVANLFSGLIVTIILIAAAPIISFFYNETRLTFPLIMISIVFLIIPFGQQFQVLFQKNLDFNFLAKIDMISNFSGFFVAIITAVINPNVMSLVYGQMTISVIKALLLCFFGGKKWRHSFYFNFNDIKENLAFGAFQIGEKTVHFFSTNVDKMIIGKIYGTEILGFYSFSYQLIIIPVLKINPIVTNIAVSLFSRVRNDKDKLKKGYLSIVNYLSVINFPIYFGFILVAPLFIPIFFGEKWSPAIEIIQILSLMGLLRSTISPNTTLTVSNGRADLGFYWTLITMCSLVPSLYIGSSVNGIIGMCWSLVIGQGLLFVLNYFFIVKRLIGDCLKEYIYSVLKPFLIAIFMFLVGYFLKDFIDNQTLSLFITIGVSGIFYLFLNLIFNRKISMEFYGLLLRKNKKQVNF
ncbi:MOP flippase family protein [Paenibacillus humicus]|uniref:MOP flippase family protein n=1 Tax=Paenibacillus humicus TaxID=412861 RepID=UPI003F14D197